MDRWSADQVVVDGVGLHVTRTGSGTRPALVCSHGITDDGPCWTTVARAFGRTHDIVMVDARGHGRSEAPAGGYGPLEHASDLVGVVRELDLRSPVLLGHSMGASTSLLVAALHPALPRAIVLEDPPPSWTRLGPPSATDRTRGAELRAWLRVVKRRAQEELAAEQRAAAPSWPAEEIARWVDAKHRFDPAIASYVDAVGTIDWRAVLPNVTCPVLLLTGAQERGALVGAAEVGALRALVPQVEVAHLPGAGHSIRHDRLDGYIEVVDRFLAEVAG